MARRLLPLAEQCATGPSSSTSLSEDLLGNLSFTNAVHKKLYDTSVRLGRSVSSTPLTPVVPGLLAAVHIDLFYF